MYIHQKNRRLIGLERRRETKPSFKVDWLPTNRDSQIVVLFKLIRPFRSGFANFRYDSAGGDVVVH